MADGIEFSVSKVNHHSTCSCAVIHVINNTEPQLASKLVTVVFWGEESRFVSIISVVLFRYRFSRPLLDFAATMTVLIMVVGILGNLLTIVALIRCPRVRNVAAAFIIRYVMFCCFLSVNSRLCVLLICKNVIRIIYKSLKNPGRKLTF